MRTPCIDCGRPVPVGSGGRCQDHKTAPRRARARWAWTTESRRARAEGTCAGCGRQVGPANLQAHHVVPLSRAPVQDGPVVPLCRRCHRMAHDELERPATARKPPTWG